jgi:oligoribonuclease NrnB/cAMP/cGMP phosphodiesterase (DHH superfamily)
MKNIIVYHKVDFDGVCGAAVIYHHLKDKPLKIKFIPMDYGDPFPFEIINYDDNVYMVDFSLSMNDMKKIKDKTLEKGSFIWLDHHISALNDYKDTPFTIIGLRHPKIAGCELAYLFTHYTILNLAYDTNYDEIIEKYPIPEVIKHLGRYDVWDLDHHNGILDFQYGLRLENDVYNPKAEIWEKLLIYPDSYFLGIEREGYKYRKILNIENENYCEHHAFETVFENLRFIALNIGNASSHTFDSVYDESKHDAMMRFALKVSPNGEPYYTVSMYTTKDINLSLIAKKYGGGGHKKACGFQIKDIKDILTEETADKPKKKQRLQDLINWALEFEKVKNDINMIIEVLQEESIDFDDYFFNQTIFNDYRTEKHNILEAQDELNNL